MMETTEEQSPPESLADRVHKLKLGSGSAAAARTGFNWFAWVLAGILAVTWAGIGIQFYKARNPVTATNQATKSAVPTNTGDVAGSGDILLAQKGSLLPATQIAVSPIEVAGRVIELNIVEGKYFKKGEVLAKLDDTSYRANMNEVTAQLTSAQQRLESTIQKLAELDPKSVRKIELDQVDAQLNETLAMQKRNKDELQRVKDSVGAISTREVQVAETDLLTANAKVEQLRATLQILKEGPRPERLYAAKADVKSAEADVVAAEARLAQSKWRLDNCTITAPINGVVLTKKAELGNLVNPLAFAATSGSICDIADLSDMEIDLDIPERDISKVVVGLKCKIRADAYEKRLYDGLVDRIMPIADDSKGVVKIRCKLILPKDEIPGSFLKPKMNVIVEILKN